MSLAKSGNHVQAQHPNQPQTQRSREPRARLRLLAHALPEARERAAVAADLTQRELHSRSVARTAQIASWLEEARWLEDRRRFEELVELTERVFALDADNDRALSHRA